MVSDHEKAGTLRPGYTTASCLPTLTRLLSGRGLPGQRIRLLTIWLGESLLRISHLTSGANDAVHSPGQLHVPLAQYKQSLHELVRLVRQADDRTRVLLITPPPLLTEFWRSEHVDWALRQGGARSAEEALRVINRDADTTKSYGQAVLMVGKEAGVDVVDLMSAMPQAVGGDTEDLLRPLFT